MPFTLSVPPTAGKPVSQSRDLSELQQLRFYILNGVSMTSWLLIGGALFVPVAIFVQPLYVLLPILAILIGRFTYCLLVTFHLLPNPHLKNSILHRASAQIPNLDGEFSEKGASEKVVCFHLGAKYNHPLGALAPNVKKLGEHFKAMNKNLDENLGNNGYMGGSLMYNVDALGAIELSFISYWRSIEAIHEFAYGPIHKSAWDWWNGMTENQSKHIGINHEIFAADPGQWEAIYVNHQPTMLGATTFLKKGDKMVGGTLDDQWIKPLMEASKGKLRSSAGRLGWQPEKLYEKFDRVPPKVNSGYEG